MSSAEVVAPARRVLAGFFRPNEGLDRESTRSMLARATEAPEGRLLLDPKLAVASVGGSIHRDGGLFCAFEGELANRVALSEWLRFPPGAGAATIVAAAYRERGESMLEALRGEFAVALWDRGTETGFLARDQLGGRTVFVHASAGRLAFATDVKWLLRLLPQQPGVDELGLVTWLALGGAIDGRTLYQGVRRLEPGSLIRLGRDGWSIGAYWRPPRSRVLAMSRDEAAESLRASVTRAVSSRLGGSGTIGISLSGGLDSSTVASLADEALAGSSSRLIAYSLTFPRHPEIDETPFIEASARGLGIPSVQMQVRGGSMLAGGLEFLRTWGIPTPIPNTVFSIELERHAMEEGTRVMLDGEGGDELFEADLFLPATLLRRARLLGAWRVCRSIPGFGDDAPSRRVRRAFVKLALRGAAPYSLHRLRRALRTRDSLTPEWFSASSARAFEESYDPWAWKRMRGPLWWAHLRDALTFNRERSWVFDYLRQISAVAGTECRHPLLDLDLVELVLQLPPQHAYDPHLTRPLLRHAMRGRLPESVRLRREKSHFTSLIYDSLFRDDMPVVRGLLEAPGGELRAFVDPEVVSTQLRAAGSGTDAGSFAIGAFRLVMAECWLRAQIDPNFPERLLASTRFTPLSVEFSTRPVERTAVQSPSGR